jgi:SAM-dependent methyltransferase
LCRGPKKQLSLTNIFTATFGRRTSLRTRGFWISPRAKDTEARSSRVELPSCAASISTLKRIRHASERYRRPNLEFIKGCLTAVPVSDAHSFDVITCFEALEHIDQHDEMMREVKRLLKPGGLFIVSIPNKETYNIDGEPNPFHVRELTFEEFDALLTRYFPAVTYFGQRVHSGSSMWPLKGGSGRPIQELEVERRDGEFQTLDKGNRSALYFVAIASETSSGDCHGSILLDRFR